MKAEFGPVFVAIVHEFLAQGGSRIYGSIAFDSEVVTMLCLNCLVEIGDEASETIFLRSIRKGLDILASDCFIEQLSYLRHHFFFRAVVVVIEYCESRRVPKGNEQGTVPY